MDLKNWYDRVREQLDRLDFPALWAGFAPCPFALYTHDTAVLNGEMMPRPAEFYGNTSVCRQGVYFSKKLSPIYRLKKGYKPHF